VRSGRTCIDKYEASVWETTDAPTIARIKDGTVTLAELQDGATLHGTAGDSYGVGCPDTGNGCKDFYAVSIPGVTPSSNLTWFQAAAAARNSGKRLPYNQEWQAAALGTPDGSPCLVTGGFVDLTGTAGCVSDVNAFDMVGNLWEWVAEWMPLSTDCPNWDSGFSSDLMCLGGASILFGPGALIRGGSVSDGANAGVFAVDGSITPSDSGGDYIGFRAAR
jgi:formylglycine-generating enzyme required for sulfatase activity